MSDIAELRKELRKLIRDARKDGIVNASITLKMTEAEALLDRVEAAERVATEMEADARERWDPMSEPEDGMYSTQKVFHMAAQLLGKEDR